jgi:hypothetical protein
MMANGPCDVAWPKGVEAKRKMCPSMHTANMALSQQELQSYPSHPYTLLRISLYERSSTESSQRRIIFHGLPQPPKTVK